MLRTTSEVLSFGRELEEASAGYYEAVAEKYPAASHTMNAFAAENQKFVKQVERVYFGVITDAIEGCFAFEIQPEEYRFTTEMTDKTDYPETIRTALGIEQQMIRFYTDAAEQSKTLMADIPRMLALIARKRSNRQARLLSLRDDIK